MSKIPEILILFALATSASLLGRLDAHDFAQLHRTIEAPSIRPKIPIRGYDIHGLFFASSTFPPIVHSVVAFVIHDRTLEADAILWSTAYRQLTNKILRLVAYCDDPHCVHSLASNTDLPFTVIAYAEVGPLESLVAWDSRHEFAVLSRDAEVRARWRTPTSATALKALLESIQ